MKKVIRTALVLYLCLCSVPMLFSLPVLLEEPNVGGYALCILGSMLLIAAALLVLAPSVGRWATVLSQIPQVLCVAAPGYYFWIYSGFIAATGFSILPRDQRWIWLPEFEAHSGSFAALTFGDIPSPQAGYALVLNWCAVLVALLAFYGLREKKPIQPPQTTPGADAALRG